MPDGPKSITEVLHCNRTLRFEKTTFRPFSWIALTVTISVKTYAKIPQMFVKVSHVMYKGVNWAHRKHYGRSKSGWGIRHAACRLSLPACRPFSWVKKCRLDPLVITLINKTKWTCITDTAAFKINSKTSSCLTTTPEGMQLIDCSFGYRNVPFVRSFCHQQRSPPAAISNHANPHRPTLPVYFGPQSSNKPKWSVIYAPPHAWHT